MTTTAKEQIVADLLSNIDRLDIDATLALFNDNALYRDVPMEPEGTQGIAGIRFKFEVCFKELTRLEMKVAAIHEVAGKVYAERVEVWHFKTGERASLPVLCVVEFDDADKIRHWREYWDSSTLFGQLPKYYMDYLTSLAG